MIDRLDATCLQGHLGTDGTARTSEHDHGVGIAVSCV